MADPAFCEQAKADITAMHNRLVEVEAAITAACSMGRIGRIEKIGVASR